MGTRALAVSLLLAAAAPSLAFAQTAGSLTANPTQVGRADCPSATTVTLSWTINTANTGGSVVSGDFYRVAVYANTDSCPAPSNAPAETDSNVVVQDVVANGDTDSEGVASAAIATAGGVTCPALIGVSASDISKKLCVYLVDSTHTAIGSTGAAAEGTFTFQLARPPAPVLDSVAAANSALIAYFHEGTATGSDNAASSTYEARAYLGTTLVSKASGAVSGIRVEGLVNGTTYTVKVVAFSPEDNVSEESNGVPGKPLDFKSFWEAYQNAGGREQGGCGGGAGALSLLALLPLALRRRRR